MYDTGIENLKKAALSVKVRSFLSSQQGDPHHQLGDHQSPENMDTNPELSLDLQSLIDDPNFEVSEGLFPELLHDKVAGLIPNHHSHPHAHHVGVVRNHSSNGGIPVIHTGYRNGGYLPAQQVHHNHNFPNSASSSPSSSPHMEADTTNQVKSEPLDPRLDYNANTVSSSSDPGYSSAYSTSSTSSSSSNNNNNSSNPLTSPSSTTSSSSGGGGGPSYSPTYGGNIHQMQGGHHQPHHNHPGVDQGGITVKNGVSSDLNYPHPPQHYRSNSCTPMTHTSQVLQFNPNAVQNHNHHHKILHTSHHGNHGSSLSKKQKNVDKASDEYKRRRERNNVAVRKSREKAKMRSRETEERVKLLSKENERLQKKIDLLTEELTFLRSFFSNVGGLPEQIHREFNKHLESFQHHHIQNGIHMQ